MRSINLKLYNITLKYIMKTLNDTVTLASNWADRYNYDQESKQIERFCNVSWDGSMASSIIWHLRVSDSKNGVHLTWWVTIFYGNLYQLIQNDQKLGKMILNLTELRPKSFGTKLNLTELGQHFLEPNWIKLNCNITVLEQNWI